MVQLFGKLKVVVKKEKRRVGGGEGIKFGLPLLPHLNLRGLYPDPDPSSHLTVFEPTFIQNFFEQTLTHPQIRCQNSSYLDRQDLDRSSNPFTLLASTFQTLVSDFQARTQV